MLHPMASFPVPVANQPPVQEALDHTSLKLLMLTFLP